MTVTKLERMKMKVNKITLELVIRGIRNRAIFGLGIRALALNILEIGDKLCGSKTVIIPKGFVCKRTRQNVTEIFEG